MRRAPSWRDEHGQVAWALAVIVLVAALSTAAIAAAYSSITRSSEQTNHIATTQRTEAAVADAVAMLSAGKDIPRTRDGAKTDCVVVSNRDVCYQYWALPFPGNAAEPLRYDVITHSWVDTDRDQLPPADGRGVRAVLTPVEAITYQTGPEVDPKSVNGKISYTASPPALLNKALYSFRSTTINGPDVRVESYNSSSGDVGTKNGQVVSSGWISYGRDIAVDSSMLFGYEGSGGTRTSRCTGEPCTESDVRVLTHSYAPATEAGTRWMNEQSCTESWSGDWVASEHDGRIAAETLCIDGALIIDAPTRITKPNVKLHVRGAIHISDSLNDPGSTQVARPSKLAIYSAGQSVTFDPQVPTSPGMSVSALMWAPRAVCSTDPATEKGSGDYLGQTTYYGSLACDTISIGGSWRHLFDDAATINYKDPVAGAAKAWTVGTPQDINTGDGWDEADGWDDPRCVLPPPVDATAYWRLTEPSGMLAADSAGSFDGTWRSGAEGRDPGGLCGYAAKATAGGQVTSSATIRSATDGVTLEWWSRGLVGTAVRSAGVEAAIDETGHVQVSAGGTDDTIPFTVQNREDWHLYTVTVAGDGSVTLYVDGNAKGTATTGSPSAGGSTVIGDGEMGLVGEAVVYSRTLTQAEVTDRWLVWTENVAFNATNPGTPFTAPQALRDAGSTNSLLSVAWDAVSGTFPAPDAYYEIQRKTDGSWEAISGPLTGLTFDETNPTQGKFEYRACAVYNGDIRCSPPAEILTLVPPEPPELSASEITTTTVVWSWTKPAFTDTFEYRYRSEGGTWTHKDLGTDRSRKFSGWTPGTKIEVQIRGLNAAGPGPWSDVRSVYLKPAAPALSQDGGTTTSLRYAWNAQNNADAYEVRYSRNGADWKLSMVTSGLKWTSSGLNQGDEVRTQVRTIGQDGTTSAWSNTVTSYTEIDAPNADKFLISYDYPRIYSQMASSNGKAICSTGIALETRVRVKVNGTWRDWGSWHQTDSSKGYKASWASSNYSTQVQHQHQNRCVNLSTGRTGPAPLANSGDIQPSPPKPTGVIAGAGGSQHQYEAYWGATCTNGTSPRFSVNVSAAWGKWSNGNVSYTTYKKNATWGKWTVKVTAWCGANGVQGPTASASKSGGS